MSQIISAHLLIPSNPNERAEVEKQKRSSSEAGIKLPLFCIKRVSWRLSSCFHPAAPKTHYRPQTPPSLFLYSPLALLFPLNLLSSVPHLPFLLPWLSSEQKGMLVFITLVWAGIDWLNGSFYALEMYRYNCMHAFFKYTHVYSLFIVLTIAILPNRERGIGHLWDKPKMMSWVSV